MEQIYEKLTEIFRDLFEDDEIELTPETTSDDIEDWDSLTHIQLISICEEEFGIKFSTAEILHLANVGDLVKVIESKLDK